MTSDNSNSKRSTSDRIKPTKEQLEYDLLKLGLSRPQIGTKYNCNATIISKYVQEYGIEIPAALKTSSTKRRALLVQGTVLTTRQNSIVIGSLLGDGSMSSRSASKYSRLWCGQSKDRKAYLDWKASELEPFSYPVFANTDKQGYQFYTVSHPIFSELRDLFYPAGLKIIPPNIIELLDELVLAVLFMDDGHLGPSYSSFSTCNFPIADVERLAGVFLEKFGLVADVRVQTKTKSGKPWPSLYLLRENHKNLHAIVDPLLHPCFDYKKLKT